MILRNEGAKVVYFREMTKVLLKKSEIGVAKTGFYRSLNEKKSDFIVV